MTEPYVPLTEDELYEDGSKNFMAKMSNKIKLQNYEAEMGLLLNIIIQCMHQLVNDL